MLKSRLLLVRPILRNYSSTFSGHEVDRILFSKYGNIAVIGLNNPEKRNAVDVSMMRQLRNVIEIFENDESSNVGVIHGEGGNFCAGLDLHELAHNENIPDTYLHNDFTEKTAKKLLVAGVNGYAVGFGLDLALWCDLRVMDETALMGCFGRRFGISMSKAGISRLYATVGFSRAMDLVTTGRNVRSDDALKWGLANRIVACGTAVGQALNLAMLIDKFPQASIHVDRAFLYEIAFANNPIVNQLAHPKRSAEQMKKDMKRGAKLFSDGVRKKGAFISRYLWNE